MALIRFQTQSFGAEILAEVAQGLAILLNDLEAQHPDLHRPLGNGPLLDIP